MSQRQGQDEVGSTHESLTALPALENVRNQRRPHGRKGSRGVVLENGFVKEILGARETDPNGPTRQESSKNSRKLVALVVILAMLLVLAIVLGAVLGTLLNRTRNSHTSSPVSSTGAPVSPTSTTSIATPTPTPQTISLAVTGWTVPGSPDYFMIWLFSQDNDGYLSRSTFNSSTRNWTKVSRFASAKSGTPLAATALKASYYANDSDYNFSGIRYQAEIVYLDNLNYVSEWIFPDTGPETGQPGSLNQQRYTASDKSHLAFYWPRLVYQSNGGQLREIDFECRSKNHCWYDTTLPTTDAVNGTQLAIAPLTNNLSSLALFYSQTDGAFVSYTEEEGQTSFTWSNEAFSKIVPVGASVAAFSTTRPSDNSSLNTYLLWQDHNGTIRMSWSDTNEGWKGPVTSAAFNGADNATAIACLTGLTFPGFPLAVGTELSRCYFHAARTVREVKFNGTEWEIIGNVPIGD